MDTKTMQADPGNDKVEVDGKRITAPAPVYVVLHKPRNVVSTMSDPEGRPSVAELLRDVGTRVYPVGRLDFATSGVLLATNDGEMSQGLLHPKEGVPKTYVVKVSGLMEPGDLDRWRHGVELEDGRTRPADVHMLRHEEDKTWFEITLKEGRNQQIRRMGEATGFPVMRLARVAFAGITNEGLRPGQWRFLTVSELQDMRKAFGVPRRARSASTAASGGRVHGKVQRHGGPRDERPRREGQPAPDRRPAPRDERPRRVDRPAPDRRSAPRDERPRRVDRPAPDRRSAPRSRQR
jgi:23S rRNA pseudouridine2605 synthase